MPTVHDVITKAMVFDPLLENTDSSILTHTVIPYGQLKDDQLEELYQYNYPQNVKWLIEIRKDFIEQHHPAELI